MLNLALATAFFLFTHIGVAGTRLRSRIVERIGSRRYVVFYSLVSAAGTVWLFQAYLTAPYVELWGQLQSLRTLALPVMLLSSAFVVLGLTSRPSTLFGERALEYRVADISGIIRVTRHPILIGLLLWSVMHMIVNGDAAALMLFGGLTLLTALGIASMDAKRRARLGDDWEDFAGRTSVFPFAAILAGRNRLVAAEIGWWRPAAALLVFLLAIDLHARNLGISPLPAGWF